MAKRKTIQSEESVEEKVLKKYKKYKKHSESEESGQSVEQNLSEEENNEKDSKISESDCISADNILKKVKKIKDKETKKAIKLRKESRKLAKIEEKVEETNEKSNKSFSALKYLNDWKHNKNEWKFKKSLQIWLLRNWQNINKINDKDFDIFVEYISAINSDSLAKKRLESEAKQLIDNESTSEDKDQEHQQIVERARNILQCF